jgi:hypothetical protein
MATTKNRSAIGTTTKARVRTVLFKLTDFMCMSAIGTTDEIIFLRNTARRQFEGSTYWERKRRKRSSLQARGAAIHSSSRRSAPAGRHDSHE